MIPLGLFSAFQNVKAKWLAKQEAKLKEEYGSVLKTLEDHYVSKKNQICEEIERKEADLILKQRDVEDLIKRFSDKKFDLEQKNKELADQIRLIEAKASPDEVWASAFQAGFLKCWEVMWNFQADQVIKLKDKIKSQAINETLGRLNGHSLQKN